MKTLLTLIALIGIVGCSGSSNVADKSYQHDADIFRARYLVEWAELIEEFHQVMGKYPLQHRALDDKPVLVQIATKEQQAFLDPKNPKYDEELDNKSPRFVTVSVKELVAEIEAGLKRDIDERYDPQRVPSGAPTYISYFVQDDGYLIWTVSRTCPPRSNSFSTLLWTGTPSINIGSKTFIKNIPKVQSIESLKANKEFVEFVGDGPKKPGFFDELAQTQVDESKK